MFTKREYVFRLFLRNFWKIQHDDQTKDHSDRDATVSAVFFLNLLSLALGPSLHGAHVYHIKRELERSSLKKIQLTQKGINCLDVIPSHLCRVQHP